MRNPQKITAVFFAFLLAGVIGVGTAQAADPDIKPIYQCPDPDTNGTTTYEHSGPCPETGGNSNPNRNAGTSTVNSSQSSQSYQSQPAQTQPEPPVTKTESKKKPTPEPQNTGTVSATVASSTATPEPSLPLWALLVISPAAGIYALVMRRANAFWQG